ncbi:heat shock factor protein isoform X3 [Cataglyphis hispanica]|uniref:heat shock factor protein isoform X3 n=1 Tax=Cataglyphis hispanica TaxID=1086592 RepID=UPI0021805925|nr:heat shock factor protein isoform X3 [Cataglyphis hispanica]
MRSPSASHLQMLVSRIISSAVGHCCRRRCEIFRCNFDRQSFTRLLAHSSFIYIIQDAHSRGIGHRRAGFSCQTMETGRGPGNRQLNLLVTYGFHKKVSVELGGLKCDKDEMEFAHQFFYKGHPYLLEHIKRKIASSKSQDAAHTPIKPELMTKVLAEVRSMRGRQENLDTKLGAIKHENEALWREIAMLRQKHLKQQQIVNKLIQFLVTLVQPSRGSGLPVKRRYPLMIDDSNRTRKQSKLSKPQASPTGPIIHELDASESSDLDSEYIVAEMLENGAPAVYSPEEYIETSIDDENMENELIENPETTLLENDIEISSHENDTRKKRLCKGKKKRKNKVPVKILIPPLENGGKPREELHLLEMPINEETPAPFALLERESIGSKPVPVASMRSSKLAAMAANINESQDVDTDIMESSADMEDDMEVSDNDASMLKLEDILIVPEIINNSNIQNIVEKKETNVKESNPVNQGLDQIDDDRIALAASDIKLDQIDDDRIALAASDIKRHNENETSKVLQDEKDNDNKASTSSSKDLPLSRVNSSDICEANYREQMDNHLETMQTDLDNLREILRGEGYSIDANTLLGLFGADDPMTFGLPINPELNPNCEKDDNDDNTALADSINGSAGGELMTYNPTSNLLDFDDDMLLENESPSLPTASSNLSTDNLYTSDPLDPLDDKASLYDSLVKLSSKNLKS